MLTDGTKTVIAAWKKLKSSLSLLSLRLELGIGESGVVHVQNSHQDGHVQDFTVDPPKGVINDIEGKVRSN